MKTKSTFLQNKMGCTTSTIDIPHRDQVILEGKIMREKERNSAIINGRKNFKKDLYACISDGIQHLESVQEKLG